MLLAWGDSVAITLMKLNKFSKEKFAVYHPSGTLGKQLTLYKVGTLLSGVETIILISVKLHWLNQKNYVVVSK